MASRYPALFHRELRALWDANPCPEVRRLLWEVSRLHGRLIEAYDLLDRMRGQPVDYTVGLGLNNLRVALEAEPAIKRELSIRTRQAARLAAERRPVLGTEMFPQFVGPPWPWPPPRTPRGGRRS
ncbi:hypothetical protein BAU07_18790 [Bordetella flabilis]|uniref:Uncharacterized protein n=1 Tax=Bordetella flabilis TaxID=463014 RepID=A0A193GH27_9BORD|nr:hypothetical protein BAU07_18790 [Bordetella flabilis]